MIPIYNIHQDAENNNNNNTSSSSSSSSSNNNKGKKSNQFPKHSIASPINESWGALLLRAMCIRTDEDQ